jgi:hypothetical protein
MVADRERRRYHRSAGCIFKQGMRSPREVVGVGEIVGRPEWLSTPTDSEMHLRVNIRFQKLVAAAAAMPSPAQR